MKKKNKKLGRLKKALLTVVIVAASVCIITAVTNTVLFKLNMNKARSFKQVEYNSQLTPQKDEDGYISFTTNEEFRVIQLTDVHIGGGFLSYKKDLMAMNAVAAMIDAQKPDLVVVTGDITYATPQAGSFNNRFGAELFAQLMESLGVYWTLTLGNHDSEVYSYYSRESVADIYTDEKYTHCLFEKGDEQVDGMGNSVITVCNPQGIITQALITLDSHSYTDEDPLGVKWIYDNIHPNQVSWYEQTVKQLTARNVSKGSDSAEPVSSLLFFHIPLVEYRDAYNEYLANGSKDTENVKHLSGNIGEKEPYVYCGAGEDGLFEALSGTKAIFCGHDHLNNAIMEYKGVRLCYGMSVDYLAYIGISKKGDQRGCTLISSDLQGQVYIESSNYYDDMYKPEYEKEEVSLTAAQ